MKDVSLVELKAKAYDVLAQIEYFQRLLSELNSQIQNYKEAEEAVVAE